MVTGSQAVLRTSCVSFTPSCTHLAFNRCLCQLIQNKPVSADKACLKGLLHETISKAFVEFVWQRDPLCCRDKHRWTYRAFGWYEWFGISKISPWASLIHSSSPFLQKLFWLSIEEEKKTKSHNWNQMKEDTSEEHMSCQRLTSSHYPIREQQCQRPTSSYYPVRGAACQRCPEILRGRGDVNKEQSLDSQSHSQRQIQTGVRPEPF